MQERALKAERQLDEVKTKLTEKNLELYRVKTELEEEQGKNQKLTSQINRDYINSSIPSSMKPNRKKISNNRKKQAKNREDNQGIPVISEKGLPLQIGFIYCRPVNITKTAIIYTGD